MMGWRRTRSGAVEDQLVLSQCVVVNVMFGCAKVNIVSKSISRAQKIGSSRQSEREKAML
uniref:Uncharacterized protein n=1 Tax=Anguilla anguilla TaxID=7936 RepID=A0A0E9WL12_ANGAN